MIRLLQLSFSTYKPIPLLTQTQFMFCRKGSNKLFKKIKVDKEQTSVSHTSNNKLKMNQNINKQHKSKPALKEQLPQQKQVNETNPNGSRKEAILNKLRQLIQAKYLKVVQQRIQQQGNSWPDQRNISHSSYDIQVIKRLMPILIQLEIPLTDKMLQFIMDGFFCSADFNVSNDQIIDRKAIQFLNLHKDKIYQLLGSYKIKKQLRFYFYLKGLSDRRFNMSTFRAVYNDYVIVVYPLILNSFSSIDFSSEFGHEVIEIFSYSIRRYLLNSQDIKLINSICSQVPFFQSKAIIKFVISHYELIIKAQNEAILSILQVMKMDRFETVKLNYFFTIIRVFSQLAKKHADIDSKVEESLHILFHNIFGQIRKDGSLPYSRNVVVQVLTQLSKQINLTQLQQGQNMFHYFNHLIQSLSKSTPANIIQQSNLLFQILSILITNKLISRKLFYNHFTSMQKSLQKIAVRRIQLKGCYLQRLLNEQQQQVLQVFNARYLLQLNSKKLIVYIKQILQLDEIEFIKSLMIMLVDSQNQYPIFVLKNQLPQHVYHQTLSNINLALIKHKEIPFYHQIFEEVSRKQDFSDLVMELIDNLYGMEVDRKQILQIFLNCIFLKMESKYGMKKILSQTIYVLQYYINNIKTIEIMLTTATFYHLVKIINNFTISFTELNQLKINIYRMLGFLLEKSNSHLIMNSLLEPILKNIHFFNQDIEKLKGLTHIYSFEKNLMKFKLNHFVPHNQIHSIYQKMANNYLRLNPTQTLIITKLQNPTYIPEGLSKENIVVYLMDENVLTHLGNRMDKVKQIIQSSSQIELALYLYKFKTQASIIKSQLFAMVWKDFTKKLDSFNKILCKEILERYNNKGLDPILYQELLLKIVGFYSSNMGCYNKEDHYDLMEIVLRKGYSQENSPKQVKKYVLSIEEYIQTKLYCFNKYLILKHYLQIIQFGHVLHYQKIKNLKSAYYEHSLGFFLIINHQNQLPQEQIQMMLSEYRRRRIERQQSDFPEVNAYIKLKYPRVNQLAPQSHQYKKLSFFEQVRTQQINRLKIIKKIFQSFSFNKNYRFLSNQQHLITFCDKKNRLFLNFLKKFYAIEPSTAHLQIHIFDFSEPNQQSFFTYLQAKGIINKSNNSKSNLGEENLIEEQIYEEDNSKSEN